MGRIEALELELTGMNARIEDAAVAGDAEEFVKLKMREAAIPAQVREAREKPVLEEIERLEEERTELEAEAQRVRVEPLPTVPPGQRGRVTGIMLHNARIAEADERARAVGREIEARRSLLARLSVGSFIG